MRQQLFILALAVLCLSCKKQGDPGESVEFYILKSDQLIPGKCQVDVSRAILPDTSAIKNGDIVSYSKNNYQFTLTGPAIQKVKALRDGTPFAVTVDRQVIYFGIFKPAISSSSCDNSITMDVDYVSGNKIQLKLGYPGIIQGTMINDERNNPNLIATLREQGKLH